MIENFRNEYNESTAEIFLKLFNIENELNNQVKISGKGFEYNADEFVAGENYVVLYLNKSIIGRVFYSEITHIGKSAFYTAYETSKEYLEKKAFK
jgi:hypothetical protein